MKEHERVFETLIVLRDLLNNQNAWQIKNCVFLHNSSFERLKI